MAVALIEREADVVRAVGAVVDGVLPRGWMSELDVDADFGGLRADGVLRVRSPDGSEACVVMEAAMRVHPRDAVSLIAKATRLAALVPDERRATPMIVAPFLSGRVRDALLAADVSYGDTTGSVRLELARPALFIQSSGADRDPNPERRPVRALRTPAAARVVRALFDARPPTLLGEIAETARVSRAQTGRIADLLEREGALERDARGSLVAVDRTKLIERWVEDYSFAGSNSVARFLEPRSLDNLLERLREVSFEYAVTGSLAARLVAPYADARLGMVYVESIERAGEALELTRVGERQNVMLAEPLDPVMLAGRWERDGVRYAALGQVAADLLTSPGRGPAEGEELLRWLEAHREQ